MAFFKGAFGSDDSFTEQLLQLSQYYTGQIEKDKTSINAGLQGIGNVINSSLTEEQLINAQRALENMKGRSSEYSDTSFTHQSMSNSLENKRYAYDEYKDSLEQSSDFINSDFYITRAEDWQDLDSLYKKQINNEGKPKYDSITDMMSQEYAKLVTLEGKIKAGQDLGFSFRGAVGTGEYDEDDINTHLGVYTGRLEGAMEALLGDETITQEEANHIMSGNMDRETFARYRNGKLAEIKDLIGDEKSKIGNINSIKLRLEEGNLKNATPFERDILGQMMQDDETGLLSTYLLGGDSEKAGEAITNQLNDAQRNLTTYYNNWNNWSGSPYGDVMGGLKEEADEMLDSDKDGIPDYIDADDPYEGKPGVTYEEMPEEEQEKILAKNKQQKYQEEHKLPEDPTKKPVEQIESVGERVLYDVVNENMPKEDWDSMIEKMDVWDAHWVGPLKSMFGAGKSSRELKYFVKNMYGKKLLSLDEWAKISKGTTGAGYSSEYEKYVNMYNSVGKFMDEYLKPSQQNVSALDEFLTGNEAPKTLFDKADHVVSGQKLYRKYMSMKDRIKFNKLRKLYRQSGLSLEEFKEKYKSEYLNNTRRLKYSHSIVQSHLKIPKWYGKMATE